VIELILMIAGALVVFAGIYYLLAQGAKKATK
jgi:hypothetical protein